MKYLKIIIKTCLWFGSHLTGWITDSLKHSFYSVWEHHTLTGNTTQQCFPVYNYTLLSGIVNVFSHQGTWKSWRKTTVLTGIQRKVHVYTYLQPLMYHIQILQLDMVFLLPVHFQYTKCCQNSMTERKSCMCQRVCITYCMFIYIYMCVCINQVCILAPTAVVLSVCAEQPHGTHK